MTFKLEDLKIDRVDLVDEGANSAAFIELYKRKERKEIMELSEILSKLEPEHAAVVQTELDRLEKAATDATANETAVASKLEKAETDLGTANDDLVKVKSELEKLQKSKATKEDADELLMKSMSPEVKAEFMKMKTQKETAETALLKAKEIEAESIAKATAASLKAIPVSEEVLVGVLKKADTELVDMLKTINTAIEATVLKDDGAHGKDTLVADQEAAWNEIDAKADEVAKTEEVTKQKAITIVIQKHPELYQKYLGGAK